MSLVLLEGVCLTTAGALTGAALGSAGLFWMCYHTRMRGFVQFELHAGMIALVCGAALGMGLLASFYPAWRASRLNTIDAIRRE